jgi:phosphate transport system permease protein
MTTPVTLPEINTTLAAKKRARAKLYDHIATGFLYTTALIATIAFIFIVAYTIINGWEPFVSLGIWDFLTKSGEQYIGLQFFNTFYMLILSLIVMLPIGLGAAIYAVEYARQGRFMNILNFAIETLTSTPSIVIGIFGAALIAGQVSFFSIGALNIHGIGLQQTRIAGALTLAILNIPWMFLVMADALRAVPQEYREASLALGATRFKTILRVVIPAAIPGIVTGILIVSGRVIGETAALVLVGAPISPVSDAFSLNPTITGETMAVHIFNLFSEPGSLNEKIRLATSLVLILTILVINLSARWIGATFNARLSGKKA